MAANVPKTGALVNLGLYRQSESPQSTGGELFCDGAHAFWTLERPGPQYKSDWHRIPAGTYPISIYNSPHFGRPMPLLAVPGHTGIEIHWGDFPQDSRGCILVGKIKSADAIWQTRDAFDALFPAIAQAVGAEGCTITVYDPPGQPAELNLQGDS